MKKLSTVIILLFIFLFILFTFTSCSKDVTPQVPKEETPTTEEGKETNSPDEVPEVDSKDETIEEETIIEDTTSSTETPLSNEDTNSSLVPDPTPLVPDTTSSEPVTNKPAIIDVIEEPTYYNSFGFIKEISSLNGINYLIIDEAEFYMYDEALQEAIKDGRAMLKEDNTYALANPYFIRNNYDTLTEYPISESCEFNICSFLMNLYLGIEVPEFEPSNTLYEVNYDEFTGAINFMKNDFNTNMLVSFEMENGYITKISQQYTP